MLLRKKDNKEKKKKKKDKGKEEEEEEKHKKENENEENREDSKTERGKKGKKKMNEGKKRRKKKRKIWGVNLFCVCLARALSGTASKERVFAHRFSPLHGLFNLVLNLPFSPFLLSKSFLSFIRSLFCFLFFSFF